ncbi:hypothetical protein OKA06_20025 [Novosphingobium sp. MW5]|nr:hypothetical protein [Novosphingobium sp. MW5]
MTTRILGALKVSNCAGELHKVALSRILYKFNDTATPIGVRDPAPVHTPAQIAVSRGMFSNRDAALYGIFDA